MARARRISRDTPPRDPLENEKLWLNCRRHSNGTIMKPIELENEMKHPIGEIDSDILDRIQGSLIGMALGDALGASVEFRPHAYLEQNPIKTLTEGGTWGLKKGQFTDDTSMGLCLASSLVVQRNYIPYDQLVRYKWWYKDGYMSSTGVCFDIGRGTRISLVEFEERQKTFAKKHKIPLEEMDHLSDPQHLDEFDANCSEDDAAGNGSLMRLAAVPLFFYRDPLYAIKCSGHSGEITHGDEKAYDACRYYGALIIAALHGASKNDLIDKEFYEKHIRWFDGKPLHQDILDVAHGSYQKKEGYIDGIRGKGYVVNALEAALWALWSDEGNFTTGVLNAVNLGDDTDTTAAIYGQLAGALYGFKHLPKQWVEQVYAKDFIKCLCEWIVYEGEQWWIRREAHLNIPITNVESSVEKKNKSTRLTIPTGNQRRGSVQYQIPEMQINLTMDRLDDPKSKFTPRRASVCHLNSTSESCSPKSANRVYENKNINTSKDVARWIRSLGKEYDSYAQIFKDSNIDGYWLLNHLDENQLIAKGIQNKGHRQVILHQLQELRQKSSVHYT